MTFKSLLIAWTSPSGTADQDLPLKPFYIFKTYDIILQNLYALIHGQNCLLLMYPVCFPLNCCIVRLVSTTSDKQFKTHVNSLTSLFCWGTQLMLFTKHMTFGDIYQTDDIHQEE